MYDLGPRRVKTKSDLVVMPSGGQIFAFFALRMTVQSGSLSTEAANSAARPTSASSRKLTSGANEKLVAMGHKATLRPDQRLHKSAAYLSLLGTRDAGSGGLFG